MSSMGRVKTSVEVDTINVVDNIGMDKKMSSEDNTNTEDFDMSKLEALRNKNKQKEAKVSAKIVAKKERSLNFGVVGTGQCGSSLAAQFHAFGYNAVAVNTAAQDLKFIDLPDSNKLLLDYSLGGAAKERSIGREAAEKNRGFIVDLVNDKLADSEVNILCTSLGGGSGSGSIETLVDVLSATGKPLMCICVLPMTSEDAKAKSNALEALAELAKHAQTKKICNLMVVDNSKIESIYSDVSQMEFFGLANRVIVEPLDSLNILSKAPSFAKPLDSMEFTRILTDGEGLSIFGELTVSNYKEDTAIAEAVIENLGSNLLAEGFDLKQSKYVGVVITANKEVWKDIPSSSVNYALAMINDQCGTPFATYKGMYEVDNPENVVKVYSIFSGLGLPVNRVEQLKKEVKEHMEVVKNKDTSRNLTLNLDTGTNETVSAAQKIKDKIAAKSSTFGKFTSNMVDRRK